MSCVLSNKVLSPQNYLEKLTGDCFIINTCDDFKQIEKILNWCLFSNHFSSRKAPIFFYLCHF